MDYQNYAMGKWISGDGNGTPLFNAITGTEIGSANSRGLDFGQMMDYSRKVGSPAIIKGDISDEMIAWKSGGTKIYQQLPEDCYNTLQKCEPLREIPANRPPQITNFKPWKETKK